MQKYAFLQANTFSELQYSNDNSRQRRAALVAVKGISRQLGLEESIKKNEFLK